MAGAGESFGQSRKRGPCPNCKDRSNGSAEDRCKAAKALGLTIAQSLLLRAERLFPTLVHTPCLGNGDAFALPFANQFTLELRERPEHGKPYGSWLQSRNISCHTSFRGARKTEAFPPTHSGPLGR